MALVARIAFSRLIEIYRAAAFEANAPSASITIGTQQILDDLRLVDDDPEAAWLSQITSIDPVDAMHVGDTVRASVGEPSLRLGILARSLGDLLKSPDGYIKVPASFYVIEGGLTADMADPPQALKAYRLVTAIVTLLGEAAAYLDPVQQELVFTARARVTVPVVYEPADLLALPQDDASALLGQFDDLHKDKKLSILATATSDLCVTIPEEKRFAKLLQEVGALSRDVDAGYQLFASEFSYAKVRRDVETAQFEYLGKIHKTFTDI